MPNEGRKSCHMEEGDKKSVSWREINLNTLFKLIAQNASGLLSHLPRAPLEPLAMPSLRNVHLSCLGLNAPTNSFNHSVSGSAQSQNGHFVTNSSICIKYTRSPELACAKPSKILIPLSALNTRETFQQNYVVYMISVRRPFDLSIKSINNY